MSRSGAWVLALWLLGVPAARAQSSPSYLLREHCFNSGGAPSGGLVVGSASYRISIASVGEPLADLASSSGSTTADAGLTTTLRPPGEIGGVHFGDDGWLAWDAEPSAGTYTVYRDAVGGLPGGGDCVAQGLLVPVYTAGDSPSPGEGWFYLVTVDNRLGEEGTPGHASDGTPRGGLAACP